MKRVQRIRHSSTDADGFLYREGEIGVDLTRKDLRVGDGTTMGGTRIPNVNYVDTQDAAVLENAEDYVDASLLEYPALDLYTAANQVLVSSAASTVAPLEVEASRILARLATGGLKAATPSEIRTLLGLVIGSDVQAYDADLAALAALAANGIISRTGAATFEQLGYANGANELVRMTADAKLPAVDGSNLTGLLASQIGGLSSFITGDLKPWLIDAEPTGWLRCNGQLVSRATYSALFALIGTTWGAGDGVTTFKLPDLRGRALFGIDTMGGSAAGRINAALILGGPGTPDADTVGAYGGEDRHLLTATESGLPEHKHQAGTASGNATAGSGLIGSSADSRDTTMAGPLPAEDPHNNMPPFFLVNWLIKT